MTKLAKVLIGVGVVGTVVAATYIVTKSSEKKTVVIKDFDEEGNPKTEIIEDESLLDRLKKAALKKAIKILTWVTMHQQQIEAAGTLISVTAGVIGFVNAINDYNHGKELHRKLNLIIDELANAKRAFNGTVDAYDHNQRLFWDKLNDIHLDLGMLHEVHEALIPEAV